MVNQNTENLGISNNSKERIAIFQASYPMLSHTINEVLAFAEAGYMVDLFLYNVNQRLAGANIKNDNISVHNFRSQSYKISDKIDNRSLITVFKPYDLLTKLYRKILWLSPIWRLFGRPLMELRERYLTQVQSDSGLLPSAVIKKSLEIMKRHKYKALIGIEKRGLIWAGIMSKRQNIPYLYHSLELFELNNPYFVANKDIFWKRLKLTENKYHRTSYATVIQDKRRAEVLLNENGVKNGRLVYMPVSVPNEPFQRSSFLQKKFNISNDKIIVFQFGWTKESRFSLELAEIAQSFNQKSLLLFHGPVQGSIAEQIQKIDMNKRIIISQDLVPDNKLHELISSAHIGLVIYPSYDFNHYLTAFASEKLALKLRSGLPIIAFRYPGYEILEDMHCGILINSLDEIPDAIEKILESYSEYSRNARDCFLEYYEYSKNMKSVIRLIAEMP